jgi:hypothetical protein
LEPTDHRCQWREEALALRKLVADQAEKLEAVLGQMQALERRVLGPKSEKMPPPAEELRRSESKEDAEARRLAGLERRRERAALKQKLQRRQAHDGVRIRAGICGGNTIKQSTANALNELNEMSLTRRDWGRALEMLKASLDLPNNHHGLIDAVGRLPQW